MAAKKGSMPMSLVNWTKLQERKCVERMNVFEEIDRKMVEGCKVIEVDLASVCNSGPSW